MDTVVMEGSPAKVTVSPLVRATANRAMEAITKTQRAALQLIIRVDMAPTMDSPSQEDMGLSPPLRATISPLILEATIIAVSLHHLKAEATTSSLLFLAITSPLPLALVTIAATPNHLALGSSRVGVAMEVRVVVVVVVIVAVAGNLEDMEAVEVRVVDMGVVEGNNSPLHMEEGLTINLPTTVPLHLRIMDNKISMEKEGTIRIPLP